MDMCAIRMNGLSVAGIYLVYTISLWFTVGHGIHRNVRCITHSLTKVERPLEVLDCLV